MRAAFFACVFSLLAAAATAQTPPIPVNNGGTGANLGATGGTSQVLKQTSTGAKVTVGQLACVDLSDYCSSVGGQSITLAGPFNTTNSITLTATGPTNVVLPTGGTLLAFLTIGTTGISGGSSGNLLFESGGLLAAGPLSGDCTTSSLVITCTKVNGVPYSASTPADNTVPVALGGAITYTQVTNAGLANSSVTVAGHTIALGGTSPLACADLSNGANGGCAATTGTAGHVVPFLDANNTLSGTQVYSAQASYSIATLSIATATFTPDGSKNDYKITLIHASCPCTLANPSATPVAGTHGTIYIIQSSTGSDTIGTWGSQYLSPGGTGSITLSTGANAIDRFDYVVLSATQILLSPTLNYSH